MKTYGIIVEGDYDKDVLEELIKKCVSEKIEVIPRVSDGSSKLMKNFPSFLQSFCFGNEGKPVDKAIVIRDADNKDPEKLEEKMRSKIENRSYPFEVKFIIIVQELETWLLADEEAISKVTQSRSGKSVSRVKENLEEITQPKERLQKLLSGANVSYTPQVAKEIAKEINLSKLEYRCPRFKNFLQAVRDC